MKILILSWRGPKHPNAGGAEISTHEHAKGWVKAGHQVVLFTSIFAGGKKEEVIDGVRIKRYGRQVFGVQWGAFKWYVFGKHSKFDLVVDQFHGIPFFTPFYVRVKKLAFIHEVAKEVWKLNPWPWPFNLMVGFAGEIFEPSIFKLMYKKIPFMTVSESTRDDLANWGIPKDQIKVIYNGATIPKLVKVPRKEKKKTAIFLGAISKDKGIEDAIKIFSEINNKKQDWQFWICGKFAPVYFRSIQDLAKKLGVIKQIKFFGYVSEVKKFELLSRSHILVNPSIREGWSLVVIEAASVGTPTVGYDVSGLRDSVLKDRTGILCPAKPEACTEAIIALMSNANKYKTLRYQGVIWSKKFKWAYACKSSLRLINSINQD